jgi:cbb3-type cytochrome oxidase cytochrome c subunit
MKKATMAAIDKGTPMIDHQRFGHMLFATKQVDPAPAHVGTTRWYPALMSIKPKITATRHTHRAKILNPRMLLPARINANPRTIHRSPDWPIV